MLQRYAALMLVLALGACGYGAPDEVVNGQAVATTPKTADWDFKQYSTFAVADKIVVHDNTTGTDRVTELDSSPLVPTIDAEMQSLGFVPVSAGGTPDVVIGLSAYKGNAVYGGYYCDWYYWGYPYYCGSYYYGEYTYGTLLMSMGDRKNASVGTNPTIQTVWGAAMYSVLSTSGYNTSIAISSIKRAFEQSRSYLQH